MMYISPDFASLHPGYGLVPRVTTSILGHPEAVQIVPDDLVAGMTRCGGVKGLRPFIIFPVYPIEIIRQSFQGNSPYPYSEWLAIRPPAHVARYS